jgi:hypothetical protein
MSTGDQDSCGLRASNSSYAFDAPRAMLLYHLTPKQLRLLRRD